MIQEDKTERTENYAPEDMTFVEEDEVFPTIPAESSSVSEEIKELSGKEETQGVGDAAIAETGSKRKVPEKTTEKKVFSSPPFISWKFVYLFFFAFYVSFEILSIMFTLMIIVNNSIIIGQWRFLLAVLQCWLFISLYFMNKSTFL